MRDLWAGGNVNTNSSTKKILGVSEAIGTILLLGISVVMVGGVALWTSTIEEGEEGLYVDLWASVQGTDLVLVHRGGDFLDGYETNINIVSSSGSQVISNSYLHFSGTSDETWNPGEEIIIDISDPSVTDSFDVVVTSKRSSGTSVVVLRNTLIKGSYGSGLPDLAITLLRVEESDTTPVTSIYAQGTYLFRVRVVNFGSTMTAPYFIENADSTITNLRLFDSIDTLEFESVGIFHYRSGSLKNPLDSDWSYLHSGDEIEFVYTWQTTPLNYRTLGLHTLNAKIVPFFDGELNYRNNYVQRKYKVDKEILPVVIHGPDPGIYDISFSNNAPNSGDLVTVTVIVQNSGDESIEIDHRVALVVSTWKPELMGEYGYEVHDFQLDDPAHYGDWKSTSIATQTLPLENDDLFPTCIKPDIVLLPGAYFFFYFTLEARVEVPGGQQWVYAAIDVYHNDDYPQGITYLNGDDPEDNLGLANIQVLPRIMVVDDDGAATGTENDMTSSVLESLIGAGVTIDKLYIAQQVEDNGVLRDAPAFNYVQDEIAAPALEDYDIVIWVTGYQKDPFTNDPRYVDGDPGGEIQNLMDFMDSKRYLLIIGTSPFHQLAVEHLTDMDASDPKVDTDQEDLDASEFLHEYIGLQIIYNEQDLPWDDTEEYLLGLDTVEDGITPLKSGQTEYRVILKDQVDGNQLMQTYTLREDPGDGFEEPIPVLITQDDLDAGNGRAMALRTTSTPSGEFGAQYRAGILSFDLNQILYLNEKINLIAGILKWFDWEINVGRDLSVTKMELFILTETDEEDWERVPIDEANVPKYLDTIELEVTIRNNGPSVESTSVLFYVTGPDGVELPIVINNPDPRPIEDIPDHGYRTDDNPQDISGIPGQGGETTVYKLWLAIGVGYYTFRVVVDPFHLITEISEDNNDISYSTSTVTSFVTQNNVLIVDDDDSEDNFDDPGQAESWGKLIDYLEDEPSLIFGQVLNGLGYEYEEYTVVNEYSGIFTTGNGPNILDLKRYNSVIWIFGDSGDSSTEDRESLTDNDILNIKKYLEGKYDEASYLDEKHNETVMFIGTNFIGDLSESDDTIVQDTMTVTTHQFLREQIGVEPSTASPETGYALYGPPYGNYLWDIYTGLGFGTSNFIDGDFSFTEIELYSGTHITTREGVYCVDALMDDKLVGGLLQMQDDASKIYYRTLVHSWDITNVNHDITGPMGKEIAIYEIIYLSMHWFGTPEQKPEFVARNSMIFFENENPVLGNSYVITVQVANLGGAAGGGTVRWMDGNVLLKSENIYLEPNKVATLEAIWTPLFAGERTVKIWVDRYDDYDEVFDIMNNIPYQLKQVYFFWDDMESGDGNWYHDSTQMMINGEGKLDYMEEPTNVDIVNEWADMDGFYMNYDVGNPTLEKEYYSSSSSFFMHEPAGTSVKSVDVVLAIDSSGSMGESYDDNDPDNIRKSAARNFINNMYDEDRVAVYDFDGSVSRIQDFTTDKTVAKSAIGSIDSDGSTALYDCGVQALNYMGTYGRDEDEAIRAVIILTDGYDTASSYRLYQYNNVKDQYDDNPSTEEKVYVFTIRLVDGDENVLRSMCTQPWDEGPYYFFAEKASDLNKIYDTIRSIIQDLAQASTRSSEITRASSVAKELFRDDFNYATRLDMTSSGNWVVVTGDPDPVAKEANSTPYCIEFESSDTLGSRRFDISGYKTAFIEFFWRGGRDGARQGILERGDRFYIDIYINGGTWLNNYYLLNDNCFTTPWTRERIQLPPEALWSDFQLRFRSSCGSSDPVYDAYYIDDFSLYAGILGPGSIGRPSLNLWADGVGEVRNKSVETEVIDLTDIDHVELSFFHKYNMKRGANGGVLMIGYSDDPAGPFTYVYTQPDQPYTGNTLITAWNDLTDDLGNPMKWCWNGLSGGGTLNWDHVTVNLDDFTGQYIVVKLQYLFTYGGTGYGWVIDDFKLTVSSDTGNPDKFDTIDNWELIDITYGLGGSSHAWSGDHSWFCGDPVNEGADLKDGVDSSLYTRQIDLTNARSATLSAYFKFNINRESGRPPDGFRVEVSTDGGDTWTTLSLGVRSSWGVSGTDDDPADGIEDKKSYTGLDLGNYWVHSSSLSRLITNLNGFTGNVIILRFRIVTDNDPLHHDISHTFDAGDEFYGVFIDDVVIYGESLESSRGGYDTEPEGYLISVKQNEVDGPGMEDLQSISSTEIEPHVEENVRSESGNTYNGWILWILSFIVIAPVLLMSVVRRRWLRS